MKNEVMIEEDSGYKNIFKTTFLFGFVQIFNIFIKVGTNKIVALLLGSEGMGIIGLFNSAIGMLQTGAGLGISQSAVRDISEANVCGDSDRFSRTISLTNKIIISTALLGVIISIILSPMLSEWAFGNDSYIIAFVGIAIVVGLNILSEGKLAILKGMRQLASLAKASMIGSVVGFISVVPFYYFWREDGIVPSLMVTAFSALFFSNYFVRNIKYVSIKLSLKEICKEAFPMMKMGSALMFTTFLANLATLVIASFMRLEGGLEDVGFYNAGSMIMTGYFGIIITALLTDYYPRIAAVNQNNIKLQEELNKQSIVSLVICCPIIVLFLFLLPFFVEILYSKEFLPIVNFVKIGMFGVLIMICSNQVDMILVAKFRIKIFTIISIIYRVVQVIMSVILYKYYGLIGMGFALMFLGIIHMIVMVTAVNKLYHIRYNRIFVKIASFVLILSILSILVSEIDDMFLKYCLGSILFLSSVTFSLIISIRYLNINFRTLLKRKV